MELPLPVWKPLLPVAREQEEGDERAFGQKAEYGMYVGERSLKLIWSQNHNIYNYVFIYIYIYI